MKPPERSELSKYTYDYDLEETILQDLIILAQRYLPLEERATRLTKLDHTDFTFILYLKFPLKDYSSQIVCRLLPALENYNHHHATIIEWFYIYLREITQ